MAANSGSTPFTVTDSNFWQQKQLRMQRKAVHAIIEGWSGSGTPKTPAQYYITNDDTVSIDGTTVSSISFSVIEGEASLSLDGGSTSVTYPVGFNGNYSYPSGLDATFDFTVAAGSNSLIINTLAV